MGIADIICEYIYGSFKLIKAAIEVAQKTAKAILKALDTLFNTLMTLCRNIIDIGIKTILDIIRVFQKWLVDSLLNIDYKSICEGLFKCTEFLNQILDPNALLTRTIKKYTNYNSKPQEELYKIINDFNQFKETVCNFGITFNFGISAIKDMLNTYYAMCDEFLSLLEKYKERIRRQLQIYLDTIIDLGIFDMLDKLKAFFDCVIVDTETCSNIHTANSFYNNTLNKLGIKESGDGYSLNPQLAANYMNSFDSRINQLNNATVSLKKLIDSMIEPSQIKSASNAFNIASNIFPGGMSWSDIKSGNFSKNKFVNYLKIKRKDFINAFKSKNNEFKDCNTDLILDNLKINDDDGTLIIKLNGQNIEYSYEDFPNSCEYKQYDNGGGEYYIKNSETILDTNGALCYDDETIVSNLKGAIDIAIFNNETLKNKCLNKFNFEGYIKDSEVIKSY